MRSDAQRKSDSKYQKSCKRVVLTYSPKESEEYKYAHSLGSRRIKKIIQETKNG